MRPAEQWHPRLMGRLMGAGRQRGQPIRVRIEPIQSVSTEQPVVLRASRSRCACATSASG